MKCRRCGCESSVFWWPYSFGCSDTGTHPNDVFHLCDDCQMDFVLFMQGHVINDGVVLKRVAQAKKEAKE